MENLWYELWESKVETNPEFEPDLPKVDEIVMEVSSKVLVDPPLPLANREGPLLVSLRQGGVEEF